MRYALPHSRILIHQPLGGAQGQATDIGIQAREILRLREELNGILAGHTGQNLERIEKDTDRDYFMRGIAADKGVVIAADKYGKMKTIAQSLALAPLLAHYSVFGFDPIPLGTFVLYLALALTVFSGGNYLYNFYKNWLQAE